MVTEIVVGVGIGALLALLGWLGGVFQAPARVEASWMQARRANNDYALWRTHADLELADEFERINADYAERGMYESGARLIARQKAVDRVARETERRLTTMSREIDDSFGSLRRADRVWMAWTVKDRGDLGLVKATWKAVGKPSSMEMDILGPVLQKRNLDAVTGDEPDQKDGSPGSY